MNEQLPLVEGEDFYREGAAIVFTARYHLRRGFCCGSGCRHCPYEKKTAADEKRKATLAAACDERGADGARAEKNVDERGLAG